MKPNKIEIGQKWRFTSVNNKFTTECIVVGFDKYSIIVYGKVTSNATIQIFNASLSLSDNRWEYIGQKEKCGICNNI